MSSVCAKVSIVGRYAIRDTSEAWFVVGAPPYPPPSGTAGREFTERILPPLVNELSLLSVRGAPTALLQLAEEARSRKKKSVVYELALALWGLI